MEITGVKDIITKFISTVSWSWTYYEGQLHTKKLNTVIYFTYSQFKILSVTVLDESMKGGEGTWVLKKVNILFLLEILVSA